MPKISGVCVGESLVGDGNEVAHVDLLLGPRGSAVETAYCIGLTNNKDGFTSTPGVTQKSSTGFPIISTLLGQFLLKDIALLAASFTLLLASLSL
jgi:hypothetical protein